MGCNLRLTQLGTVCFQNGGIKPEVVYRGTFLRRIRGFLIDLNSTSLLQRVSIKNLMRDSIGEITKNINIGHVYCHISKINFPATGW